MLEQMQVVSSQVQKIFEEEARVRVTVRPV
jgi:hypothetical protein